VALEATDIQSVGGGVRTYYTLLLREKEKFDLKEAKEDPPSSLHRQYFVGRRRRRQLCRESCFPRGRGGGKGEGEGPIARSLVELRRRRRRRFVVPTLHSSYSRTRFDSATGGGRRRNRQAARFSATPAAAAERGLWGKRKEGPRMEREATVAEAGGAQGTRLHM
jgi:hypothetical protein